MLSCPMIIRCQVGSSRDIRSDSGRQRNPSLRMFGSHSAPVTRSLSIRDDLINFDHSIGRSLTPRWFYWRLCKLNRGLFSVRSTLCSSACTADRISPVLTRETNKNPCKQRHDVVVEVILRHLIYFEKSIRTRLIIEIRFVFLVLLLARLSWSIARLIKG